jgi:hypothetical protein
MLKALAALENELDAVWQAWRKPIVMTEFGADTVAGIHGHPSMMWTEEYQAELVRGYLSLAARKPYIAGMQVGRIVLDDSAAALLAELHTQSLGRALRILDETTSTIDIAREWARSNAPDGAVVLAARQTRGRGRHARLGPLRSAASG